VGCAHQNWLKEIQVAERDRDAVAEADWTTGIFTLMPADIRGYFQGWSDRRITDPGAPDEKQQDLLPIATLLFTSSTEEWKKWSNRQRPSLRQ
jgi:hypothetical protein